MASLLSMPVLFHPDCNRRPRNFTGSADPGQMAGRSRAIPPVGTSTPPWETGGDRNGRRDTRDSRKRGRPQYPNHSYPLW